MEYDFVPYSFLLIYSQWCCLWKPHSCQRSHCGPATHCNSELSNSLPVSAVRVYSIATKLSVWRWWNMEPRPVPSGMHNDTNNTANISISRYSWRLSTVLDQKVYWVLALLYRWSMTLLDSSVDADGWMQCWSIPQSVLCSIYQQMCTTQGILSRLTNPRSVLTASNWQIFRNYSVHIIAGSTSSYQHSHPTLCLHLSLLKCGLT